MVECYLRKNKRKKKKKEEKERRKERENPCKNQTNASYQNGARNDMSTRQ